MSFSPTLVRCSSKLPPSSKRWLARQFRDPLVKLRASHPAQFRSRSAFKLLELSEKYKFFDHDDVRAVVDLGAAPGGWSQVAAGKMGLTIEDVVGSRSLKQTHPDQESDALDEGFGLEDKAKTESYGSWSAPLSEDKDSSSCEGNPNVPQKQARATIVAVDLLSMYPIPGVKTLQMDFLSPQADQYINALLADESRPDGVGKADIILSDMAANFTGNRTSDVESSLQICEVVFEFTKRHLRTASEIGRKRGGALILKHFQHPLLDGFKRQYLQKSFHFAYIVKPDSSRSESSEAYWVCLGWKGLDK